MRFRSFHGPPHPGECGWIAAIRPGDRSLPDIAGMDAQLEHDDLFTLDPRYMNLVGYPRAPCIASISSFSHRPPPHLLPFHSVIHSG